MDKQKPRICEVLGVEIGERFIVRDEPFAYDSAPLLITEEGNVVVDGDSCEIRIAPAVLAIHAINHPESIVKPPRFTEEEVKRVKAAKVLWPRAESVKKETGAAMLYGADGEAIAGIETELFPSILPGETVKLSDVVGGEA